jgi:hypothetical protein
LQLSLELRVMKTILKIYRFENKVGFGMASYIIYVKIRLCRNNLD